MVTKPEDIVNQLGLADGISVADLGVGYGHYAYALSKAVGPNGKVLAVDIQKSMIERLKKEVDEKGLKNIEVIWGDIEVVGGTKLREASVDVVLAANILFQIDSKSGFVHECSRILKKGGRLILIDWKDSFGGLGPHQGSVVEEETAIRLFETGPFKFRKNVEAGEHHYGLLFERKDS